MSAPENWPINRLVYPEEALRLAAESLGLVPIGGYLPNAKVVVRDATGRLLRNVIACCESTGQVIQVVTDGNGNVLIANCRNEAQRADCSYPAPLQISYERPSEP